MAPAPVDHKQVGATVAADVQQVDDLAPLVPSRMPPVVLKIVPEVGTTDVDPNPALGAPGEVPRDAPLSRRPDLEQKGPSATVAARGDGRLRPQRRV